METVKRYEKPQKVDTKPRKKRIRKAPRFVCTQRRVLNNNVYTVRYHTQNIGKEPTMSVWNIPDSLESAYNAYYEEDEPHYCGLCGTATDVQCDQCGSGYCAACAETCGLCGDAICPMCYPICDVCNTPLCMGCAVEYKKSHYCCMTEKCCNIACATSPMKTAA